MNDDSNIEIINFDILNNDDIFCNYDNEQDFNITNLIDKYNWNYLDSLSQQRESETPSTLNDSFSSHCYSENTFMNTSLNFSEDSDRSCYSDNCYPQVLKKKTFACKDCNKVYKSKENLTLHYKNIHLKLKPYSCKYCTAVFSHRNGRNF